ncbi:MAG: hypothetical protein GWP69_21100 [Gammaproteobacteria bacterium]|jgi:hypothetical protein|nr:hypothetical protein [Gammaproteobacteria bacterium]
MARVTFRSLIVGVLLFAANGTAMAQGDLPESETDKWQFTIAPLYLWAVGIDGDIGLGPATAPVNIKFSDALSNLSGAFTLHFEARKEKWNVLADYMWVGLEPSATLPTGAPLNVDLDMQIGELGGTYLVTEGSPFVEVLAGARYQKIDLKASPTPVSVDENWWDGFVGARITGQWGNWKVVGRADVGGGGSDLVWNVSLLGDYRFKNWGSVFAGYRVLDYDYSSGSGASRFVFDTRLQGPLLGLAFHF